MVRGGRGGEEVEEEVNDRLIEVQCSNRYYY